MASSSIPQCVYVLTSWDDPDMIAMAHAAILTLQDTHPEADVHVMTDPQTQQLIKTAYPALLDDIDGLITIETPVPDAPASSRFLKTSLRDIIEGDFIFLDIDTVVLRDLGAVYEHGLCFAGVRDDHHLHGVFPEDLRDRFEQLGWPQPSLPYYNSGVLFMRDLPETRDLGRAWHKFWHASRSVMGGTDQPALHQAMRATGVWGLELPQDFNQKVRDRPQNIHNPAVLHYTTRSALSQRHELINHLLRYAKKHGTLDRATLDRARERNDPWVSAGPGVWGNWHTGRYMGAFVEGLRWIQTLSVNAFTNAGRISPPPPTREA